MYRSIIAEYQTNHNLTLTAQLAKMSVNSVINIMKRYGIPLYTPVRRTKTGLTDRIQRYRDMRKTMTCQQIADSEGITRQAVQQFTWRYRECDV
jgi:hypothetical protein